MTTHLTLPQLESYLWGAATILRGLVDAGDYKQFIFPRVFYKRLSDVWDEDYSQALATYDGSAELARAQADERFIVPEGAHWSQVRTVAKDVGRALQDAMRAIEGANPGRFDGIFGDARWTNKERLPDATLKNLLERFASQSLSIAKVPEDTLGDAYEYLIGRFADDGGHTAQEFFYTNRTVVHLMTQMLDPQAGRNVSMKMRHRGVEFSVAREAPGGRWSLWSAG
jgi:type I restriction enzyme M protein